MGTASLNGRTFQFDPSSVSWTFSAKVSETFTVGGKVVQVFGTRIDDMRISGTNPSWQAQEDFFSWIRGLARQQAESVETEPFRFLFPGKRWDFEVYIKSIQQQGSARSVQHDAMTFAPGWSLTLFIVQDNTGLRQVAQDSFIKRIAKGFGWKQTKFNGPLGFEEVEEILEEAGVDTVEDYLSKDLSDYLSEFTGGPTSSMGTGESSTSDTGSPGEDGSDSSDSSNSAGGGGGGTW